MTFSKKIVCLLKKKSIDFLFLGKILTEVNSLLTFVLSSSNTMPTEKDSVSYEWQRLHMYQWYLEIG